MRLKHPEGNMRAYKTERFQVLVLRFQYAVLTDNDEPEKNTFSLLNTMYSVCAFSTLKHTRAQNRTF